jgi:hypothetical protein
VRGRGGRDLASCFCSGGLRRELVQLAAHPAEGQELRLEPTAVVVGVGLAGVAHGRE